MTFINDHQYQLTATARDNATNAGNTSATFVYDVQKPTSAVTSPVPGYLNTLTTISGAANDQGGSTHPSGISVASVTVAIQQVGGSWWNGSTFGGANPLYSSATFVGASSGT